MVHKPLVLGSCMMRADSTILAPVPDVIVVAWPIKSFMQVSQCLVSTQETGHCFLMEVPEVQGVGDHGLKGSSRIICRWQHRTPLLTTSWSQICTNLRADLLAVGKDPASGLVSASFPHRRGPTIGSASWTSLTWELASCKVVTVTSAVEVSWLGWPH